MGDLVVTRWRKFGHDRLMVNGPAGERIGHVDLNTGERVCLHPDQDVAMVAAVDTWRSGQGERDLTAGALGTRSVPPPVPQPQTAAVEPTTTPGDDRRLADRVPGQSVITELLHVQAGVRCRGRVARILGRSPLSPDGKPWFKGARGERQVGRLLAALGPDWRVLHAVPVGDRGSDIDHVVIGAGGVFTINTKEHSTQTVWVAGRTFLVNGQKTDHVRNSEHEAARAERVLSAALGRPVPVVPVIAVVDPKSLTLKQEPQTVRVVTSGRLVRFLRKRDAALTPAEVDAVAAAASNPATWSRQPLVDQDRSDLHRRFEVVEREVRGAYNVRRAWFLGRMAAGAAVVVTVLLHTGDLMGWLVQSSTR